MPAKRLSMRKIKEILRLKHEVGLSVRQIAKSCSVGKSTVYEYLSRASAAGLSWPLDDSMDEARLERLLFAPDLQVPSSKRPLPIWADIHKELRSKKKVTLTLLWEEYKASHPADGYQYSQFCERYSKWKGALDVCMRHEHRAGEKMFIDYCGQTVPVVNPGTGEIREAEIFVAVLGASNYTFAEATWSQSLPDWIASHQRAFAYFNGVTELLVPDNIKSGVTKACRYEPDLNPTYQDMASHYGTAVIPARVRKARDKAKVEVGVQVVERWILAALRNRTFFSLSELNGAIEELLVRLNAKQFKKLPGSRRSQYETLDRPVLKPLPSSRYEYAEWKNAKAGIDYHIEVDRHYYSVPYQLAQKKFDVRITASIIEVFHRGKRVASHCRSYLRGKHTTVPGHMPRSHREYLKWTPERLLSWASKTGPSAEKLAGIIMRSRPHPQQGFRSILGILRLTKTYDDKRVDAACSRALAIGSYSYKSVASILKNNLDHKPLQGKVPEHKPIDHPNIRGSRYYSTLKGETDAYTSNP
jgi:transposase